MPAETVGYLHCFPSGNSPEGARGDLPFFFTVSVGYLQPFGECGREHRSTIAPPSTRDHFSLQKTVLTGLQTRGTATETKARGDMSVPDLQDTQAFTPDAARTEIRRGVIFHSHALLFHLPSHGSYGVLVVVGSVGCRHL